MIDPHKVHSRALNLTLKELITYVYHGLSSPNFQSFDEKGNPKQHVID